MAGDACPASPVALMHMSGANGNWSLESLHVAVQAAELKRVIYQAADDMEIEIPESMLRHYVKKEQNDYPLNLGRYR